MTLIINLETSKYEKINENDDAVGNDSCHGCKRSEL